MITRKLNPRVYDSLLVLLDAVRLYRVYRQLDTLPLYLYYELLVTLVASLYSSQPNLIQLHSPIVSYTLPQDKY